MAIAKIERQSPQTRYPVYEDKQFTRRKINRFAFDLYKNKIANVIGVYWICI